MHSMSKVSDTPPHEPLVLDFSKDSDRRSATQSWILFGLKDGPAETSSIRRRWKLDVSEVKRALNVLRTEGLVFFDRDAKGWSLTETGQYEVEQALTKVDRLLRQILSAHPEFWQQLKHADHVHRAFKALDLFVAPSMDEGLVVEIMAMQHSGAAREAVVSRILAYYDGNSCAALAALVNRLCTNDAFVDWEHTLRQALSAHCRGEYDAITAYPLAAMVEGILLPFLSRLTERLLTGSDRIKYEEIARILLTQLSFGQTAQGAEIVLGLIDYMQHHFYDSSGEENGPQDEYSPLNRHYLLHGRQKGGKRLDTLLCFLMLDTLEAILATAYGRSSAYDLIVNDDQDSLPKMTTISVVALTQTSTRLVHRSQSSQCR